MSSGEKAGASVDEIGRADIEKSFQDIIAFRESGVGGHVLRFPNQVDFEIKARDIRQYGSVAYSLRAILAVQQDSMMDPTQAPLKPIAAEALEMFKLNSTWQPSHGWPRRTLTPRRTANMKSRWKI